jgi:hypothetical protein
MTAIEIKAVRARAWLNLSAGVAQTAGLSLAELQQFAIGAFTPPAAQLTVLARALGFVPALSLSAAAPCCA